MRVYITVLASLGLLASPLVEAYHHRDRAPGGYEHKSQHHKHHKQKYKAKRKMVSPQRDEPFFRLTYSNQAEFERIGQPEGDLLNVTFGRLGQFRGGAGSFLHFGTSLIDIDGDGNEFPSQLGRWYLLSVGLSISPTPWLELYGGPGWAWSETLTVECEECEFETVDDGPKHDEVNWHVGGTYRWHKQIGISVEYDSAPRAISVGFTFSSK